MRDGKGMEKIDRILTEQIQSGRRYSEDFYEFVEDRNKDVGLYDYFLETGKKGVEVYKIESALEIPGIDEAFVVLVLALGWFTGMYYDFSIIGMIAGVLVMIFALITAVRIAVSTMPFLGFKYVCKTLDKKVTLLYIQSGLLDYKAYKEYHESVKNKKQKKVA